MSYLLALDEFSEHHLRAELARRERLRAEGKCDYCARAIDLPPCKFPDRHRRPLRAPKVVKTYRYR